MDIKEFIALAKQEDIKDGDHSTLACIQADAVGSAQLLVKENGIIAGVEIARQLFNAFDSTFIFHQLINDGENVKPGDIVFKIEGSSRSLLSVERLVLNVMQRMSAIATLTNKYVVALNGLYHKRG